MISIIKRSGLLIPNRYENTDFYCNIRAHLTRKTKEYNSELFTTQKYFLETERHLNVPRFFPIHNYYDFKVLDTSHEGEDIHIEHNIMARNDIQRKTMNFMLTKDNAIIQLNPGTGKTVISIYAIAERKKKSFILVHRDSLVKQWRDRIVEFTNLESDQIGILSSAKFDEEMDKPIVIGTNQTFISLLKRKRVGFLIKLNKAKFGIFIADEVHTTVGAETFSECSIHMPCRVTFGLSATPYRYDGNTDIIEYHLGKVFNIESTEGTMPARVTVIGFDYQIDQPRRYRYLHWDGNFQRARYLNIMKNSKIFMNIVKSIVMKVSNEKRKALVICERVEKLIDILYDWYPLENKGRFVAGSSRKELEKNVVFSTPNKIRDGVDANWLDCLVVTSPVGNMEQLAGRINRLKEGKKIPIIIDMVDMGCPNIKNTLYKRLEFYNKKKWKIQFIFINSDMKRVLVDEDQFLKIMKGE